MRRIEGETIDNKTTNDYITPNGFDEEKKGVSYGEQIRITYYSETTRATRKANIILPAYYDNRKRYPVLYLLHGIGGNQEEWLQANPRNIIGNLEAAGQAEEMIIVIPNVRARANDKIPPQVFSLEHYRAFDNFINDLKNDLMPYVMENYAVAKGRENTAIVGLSMGGREALYIGLSLPDVFGYIGAFSPAFGIFEYENNHVREPGLFKEESFLLPDLYKKNTLLVIMNGENDEIVYNVAQGYHACLQRNGTPHRYYTVPGGHDFHVWKNGLYHFSKEIFKKV